MDHVTNYNNISNGVFILLGMLDCNNFPVKVSYLIIFTIP